MSAGTSTVSAVFRRSTDRNAKAGPAEAPVKPVETVRDFCGNPFGDFTWKDQVRPSYPCSC